MDDGRERSIYRGIVVSSLVLIIIPIIPFLLIYFAILKYDTTMSDEMRLYSAMMFGFGTGSLFHISCILLGFLRDDFKILLKSIKVNIKMNNLGTVNMYNLTIELCY